MTVQGESLLGRIRAPLRGTPVHLAWRYLASAVDARRSGAVLDGVATYCLFIGHARSGHSIVGALLDAHPQIAISDELDALSYVAAGFSRRQVLSLSIAVAQGQARRERRKAGRAGVTYSYFVPGQFQGRHEGLAVVGDSHAGWTTRKLSADRELLPRLEGRMAGLQLRFIHVMRNPYDNIATMMIRSERTFDAAFAQYFDNCERLVSLSSRIGAARLLRVRHEDVIGKSRQALTDACTFLGVEPSEAYLAACASILYERPSRTRGQVAWSDAQVAQVRERIARYDFLADYRFEE